MTSLEFNILLVFVICVCVCVCVCVCGTVVIMVDKLISPWQKESLGQL